MPDWTIVVDRDACMGTGTCMAYAESLTFGEDGKASVASPITDDLDAVRAAVESCPASALSLADANT